MTPRLLRLAALTVLGVAVGSCSGSDFPTSPVTPARVVTAALAVVDGTEPDEPSGSISMYGLDGTRLGQIDLPAERITRLRATSSDDHVVVLTREVGGSDTDVSITELSSGRLIEAELPQSDWEGVPAVGGPSPLTVVADSQGKMAAIGLADGRVLDLPVGAPTGSHRVSSSPSGDHLAVQGARGLAVVDVATRTITELPGMDFVRWTGTGVTLEAIDTVCDGGHVLRAFDVDGTEGPTNVAYGTPRVTVPTAAGLLTLHDHVVSVVSTAGGEVLHEGDGPFTEFLTVQTTSGQAVVFDGSGSGGEARAIDAAGHRSAALDIPLGISPIRLRSSGPTPPWLLDTRAGDLVRVDPERLVPVTVGRLDDDRLPEPREFHPGTDAVLVLRRTEGSVLERRATVFGPNGPADVWLGTNPSVTMSASGSHAAVSGTVDGTGTVTLVELGAGGVLAEVLGHSPAWLDRRAP